SDLDGATETVALQSYSSVISTARGSRPSSLGNPGFASANGAKCKSLGQRPRDAPVNFHRALKARNKTCARTYFALSGLRFISQTNPGALPRAISFGAFSARTPSNSATHFL